MDIKHALLAPHIQRWTVVPVTRRQNIAEHSHSVAMLAGELYRELVGTAQVEHAVLFQIYALALWHDMPEVITGDINSAFKDGLSAPAAADLERMESMLCPQLLDMREAQKYVWQEAVVKIADQMEAALYISHWIPNRHWRADSAREFIWGKVEKLAEAADRAHPQFEWVDAAVRVMERASGFQFDSNADPGYNS